MEEWGLIEIREVGDEEAARLLLLRAFFFFFFAFSLHKNKIIVLFFGFFIFLAAGCVAWSKGREDALHKRKQIREPLSSSLRRCILLSFPFLFDLPFYFVFLFFL